MDWKWKEPRIPHYTHQTVASKSKRVLDSMSLMKLEDRNKLLKLVRDLAMAQAEASKLQETLDAAMNEKQELGHSLSQVSELKQNLEIENQGTLSRLTTTR